MPRCSSSACGAKGRVHACLNTTAVVCRQAPSRLQAGRAAGVPGGRKANWPLKQAKRGAKKDAHLAGPDHDLVEQGQQAQARHLLPPLKRRLQALVGCGEAATRVGFGQRGCATSKQPALPNAVAPRPVKLRQGKARSTPTHPAHLHRPPPRLGLAAVRLVLQEGQQRLQLVHARVRRVGGGRACGCG